ncbi:DotU family type IV/VI secretion system protein [Rhodanobacter glycinis]|uniref:DotU family type IV/VI secretion system protein n=1 Tax=Rhodanobacter glycinis TaxID=582702 RepID=A0A5B9DVP1_9GAMM|nr:type IVB secretion system protein IcmH/DotU [Rhodanobacter glycinis]QEE23288.1 DotU family type IV/VI secretion system protein [Rhodanobacter glycinis]
MTDNRTPQPAATPAAPAAGAPRSLLDLMSDGFYMLLLIKRGQVPLAEQPFADAVRQFLANMERNASREGIPAEDVHAAKYAYCAVVDEAILSSTCSFREEWARKPLQLALFGDHLAGENFFVRLEQLRAQGAARLQSLEVCYFCLLLGFEGKYRLEGSEKLGYLTARLGDEIVYLKGKRTGFAPHWAPPDRVANVLRRTVPLWAAAAVLVVAGLIGYFSLHVALQKDTTHRLAAYHDLVQMPARTASLTITLP